MFKYETVTIKANDSLDECLDATKIADFDQKGYELVTMVPFETKQIRSNPSYSRVTWFLCVFRKPEDSELSE